MVKDRVLTSQETSRQARKTGRLAADPSSLYSQTERPGSWLRRLYIMAAGGAGSSGLPAFERGNLTNKVPSKKIMMEPAI